MRINLGPVGETSWSRWLRVGETSWSRLGIGPTSVVRERPIPNGSGSLGNQYARTSDDLALQGLA